jgi:hypothetical protein
LAQDGVVFDNLSWIAIRLVMTDSDDDPDDGAGDDGDGNEGQVPNSDQDEVDVPRGASLRHSTLVDVSADRLAEMI